MTNNPLVSICIPTRNGERYIHEAMESAIKQTYSNIEIIISDDHSDDQTLSYIEKIGSETEIDIKIFSHKPAGIGANWNKCIEHANGHYIKFLFQDDVLLTTCVEKMVSIMEQEKGLGLVASKREFLLSETNPNQELREWQIKYQDLQAKLDLPLDNSYQTIDFNIFSHPNFFYSPMNKIGEPPVTMFPKSIIADIGPFREDMKQILDIEFYYRVLKKYKIAIIPEALIKFRLHENQTTIVNRKNKVKEYPMLQHIIFNEYYKYLNIKDKIKFFLMNASPFK